MKIIIATLVLASLAFGDTTWNASWDKAIDYKIIGGQLVENGYAAGYKINVFNSNDSLIQKIDSSDTTETFIGPDSICVVIRAYDTSGNLGPESIPACVQKVAEWQIYDVNGDGKVTGADVIELRLKVWFGGETEKHDINKDGKVTGADVINLRLYIKETN